MFGSHSHRQLMGGQEPPVAAPEKQDFPRSRRRSNASKYKDRLQLRHGVEGRISRSEPKLLDTAAQHATRRATTGGATGSKENRFLADLEHMGERMAAVKLSLETHLRTLAACHRAQDSLQTSHGKLVAAKFKAVRGRDAARKNFEAWLIADTPKFAERALKMDERTRRHAKDMKHQLKLVHDIHLAQKGFQSRLESGEVRQLLAGLPDGGQNARSMALDLKIRAEWLEQVVGQFQAHDATKAMDFVSHHQDTEPVAPPADAKAAQAELRDLQKQVVDMERELRVKSLALRSESSKMIAEHHTRESETWAAKEAAMLARIKRQEVEMARHRKARDDLQGKIQDHATKWKALVRAKSSELEAAKNKFKHRWLRKVLLRMEHVRYSSALSAWQTHVHHRRWYEKMQGQEAKMQKERDAWAAERAAHEAKLAKEEAAWHEASHQVELDALQIQKVKGMMAKMRRAHDVELGEAQALAARHETTNAEMQDKHKALMRHKREELDALKAAHAAKLQTEAAKWEAEVSAKTAALDAATKKFKHSWLKKMLLRMEHVQYSSAWSAWQKHVDHHQWYEKMRGTEDALRQAKEAQARSRREHVERLRTSEEKWRSQIKDKEDELAAEEKKWQADALEAVNHWQTNFIAELEAERALDEQNRERDHQVHVNKLRHDHATAVCAQTQELRTQRAAHEKELAEQETRWQQQYAELTKAKESEIAEAKREFKHSMLKRMLLRMEHVKFSSAWSAWQTHVHHKRFYDKMVATERSIDEEREEWARLKTTHAEALEAEQQSWEKKMQAKEVALAEADRSWELKMAAAEEAWRSEERKEIGKEEAFQALAKEHEAALAASHEKLEQAVREHKEALEAKHHTFKRSWLKKVMLRMEKSLFASCWSAWQAHVHHKRWYDKMALQDAAMNAERGRWGKEKEAWVARLETREADWRRVLAEHAEKRKSLLAATKASYAVEARAKESELEKLHEAERESWLQDRLKVDAERRAAEAEVMAKDELIGDLRQHIRLLQDAIVDLRDTKQIVLETQGDGVPRLMSGSPLQQQERRSGSRQRQRRRRGRKQKNGDTKPPEEQVSALAIGKLACAVLAPSLVSASEDFVQEVPSPDEKNAADEPTRMMGSRPRRARKVKARAPFTRGHSFVDGMWGS